MYDIDNFCFDDCDKRKVKHLFDNLPSEFVSALTYAFLPYDKIKVCRIVYESKVRVDDSINRGFERVDSPYIHMSIMSEQGSLVLYRDVMLTYNVGSTKRFRYQTKIYHNAYSNRDVTFVYRLSIYFKYKCKLPFTDNSFASIDAVEPDPYFDRFEDKLYVYLSTLNYDLQSGQGTSILKSFVLDNINHLDTMIDICSKYEMKELLMFILSVTKDNPKPEIDLRL